MDVISDFSDLLLMKHWGRSQLFSDLKEQHVETLKHMEGFQRKKINETSLEASDL